MRRESRRRGSDEVDEDLVGEVEAALGEAERVGLRLEQAAPDERLDLAAGIELGEREAGPRFLLFCRDAVLQPQP